MWNTCKLAGVLSQTPISVPSVKAHHYCSYVYFHNKLLLYCIVGASESSTTVIYWGVTKLIVFCSCFVLFFFLFIPLCKGERSEENTYLNTELHRIFLTWLLDWLRMRGKSKVNIQYYNDSFTKFPYKFFFDSLFSEPIFLNQ